MPSANGLGSVLAGSWEKNIHVQFGASVYSTPQPTYHPMATIVGEGYAGKKGKNIYVHSILLNGYCFDSRLASLHHRSK